jgi:hypothetical protein
MLAPNTDLGTAECGVAAMALPVDAHADWLLYAVGFFFYSYGPFYRLDCYFEAFPQFADAFGVELCSIDFHGLCWICGGRYFGLGGFWGGGGGWFFWFCCAGIIVSKCGKLIDIILTLVQQRKELLQLVSRRMITSWSRHFSSIPSLSLSTNCSAFSPSPVALLALLPQAYS